MPSYTIALIALGLAPFGIYLALKKPLIFPLGLYIMMVPFDALLGTTATLTRFIAIFTAATLIFSMIASRRVLAPPKSWTAWAIYILLASISALWTIDSNQTFIILGQIVQLFLFYSILAVYPVERGDVRFIGTTIIASGTFVSLVGLLSYLSGFRTQENRLSIAYGGLLLDPNHIAAAMLLPILLAVGVLLGTRDVRVRFGAGATIVIMVTALLLTGSRGGLISLAVALLYLAWQTRYRLQILTLMACAGVASLFEPTVWDRFADKDLVGGSGRTFIWDVGKAAFSHHWLTGAGIGGFQAAYDHELLTTYQRLFQGWSRPAHNAYLSAAVELGIFGTVLLVHAWWKTWQDARGNVVIEAAVVGLAVAAYFLDVLMFKYFWLAFTMAALVKNAAEPKFLRGGKRQPGPGRRERLIARSLFARRRAFATSNVNETIVSNS